MSDWTGASVVPGEAADIVWLSDGDVMVMTVLTVLGSVTLVLHAASRLPTAATSFVRTLIPLVRAVRALQAECRMKDREPIHGWDQQRSPSL